MNGGLGNSRSSVCLRPEQIARSMQGRRGAGKASGAGSPKARGRCKGGGVRARQAAREARRPAVDARAAGRRRLKPGGPTLASSGSGSAARVMDISGADWGGMAGRMRRASVGGGAVGGGAAGRRGGGEASRRSRQAAVFHSSLAIASGSPRSSRRGPPGPASPRSTRRTPADHGHEERGEAGGGPPPRVGRGERGASDLVDLRFNERLHVIPLVSAETQGARVGPPC